MTSVCCTSLLDSRNGHEAQSLLRKLQLADDQKQCQIKCCNKQISNYVTNFITRKKVRKRSTFFIEKLQLVNDQKQCQIYRCNKQICKFLTNMLSSLEIHSSSVLPLYVRTCFKVSINMKLCQYVKYKYTGAHHAMNHKLVLETICTYLFLTRDV